VVAGFGIPGVEAGGALSCEDEASGGGDEAAEHGFFGAGFPHDFSGDGIDGCDIAPDVEVLLVAERSVAGLIDGAFFEFLRNLGHDHRPVHVGGVDPLGLGIVGGGGPVGAAGTAGGYDHAVGVGRGEEVFMGHVGFGCFEEFAGLAVEEVEDAEFREESDDLTLLALKFDVEKEGRAAAVVVPNVVGDVLKSPGHFAGVHVDGTQRVAPEVVAGTDIGVVVGAGVTGGDVDEAKFRVEGRGGPYGHAAVFPGVGVLVQIGFFFFDIAIEADAEAGCFFNPIAFPASIFRRGDGVPGPKVLTVVCIERFEESANTEFATGRADENLTVVGEGSGGLAVAG